MSSEQKRSRDLNFDHIDETDLDRYLRTHPDFFERHPGLLAYLRLPHEPGANTVSLIERQVAILRERNRKLDQKLRELVAVARANDILAGKIHNLSMLLIDARDPGEILATVEAMLRKELGSDRSVLVLFEQAPADNDLFDAAFVRRLSRQHDGLELFQSFLKTSRPRCGQIKGAKREFLFGKDGNDIESAALIPLGVKAATGFLAIGSTDPARFHPGMSTDFLARLGELIDRGLGSAAVRAA